MSVNVRELKTRLSEYLRRAERGEVVEVTSHGRVVARLMPPPVATESAEDRLRQQPWFKPARESGPLGLDPPERLDDDLPDLSDLVIGQRQ